MRRSPGLPLELGNHAWPTIEFARLESGAIGVGQLIAGLEVPKTVDTFERMICMHLEGRLNAAGRFRPARPEEYYLNEACSRVMGAEPNVGRVLARGVPLGSTVSDVQALTFPFNAARVPWRSNARAPAPNARSRGFSVVYISRCDPPLQAPAIEVGDFFWPQGPAWRIREAFYWKLPGAPAPDRPGMRRIFGDLAQTLDRPPQRNRPSREQHGAAVARFALKRLQSA